MLHNLGQLICAEHVLCNSGAAFKPRPILEYQQKSSAEPLLCKTLVIAPGPKQCSCYSFSHNTLSDSYYGIPRLWRVGLSATIFLSNARHPDPAKRISASIPNAVRSAIAERFVLINYSIPGALKPIILSCHIDNSQQTKIS
jgi:hypothetical protein